METAHGAAAYIQPTLSNHPSTWQPDPQCPTCTSGRRLTHWRTASYTLVPTIRITEQHCARSPPSCLSVPSRPIPQHPTCRLSS
ncbi:hypothetical protein XENTR_v10010969 [Xenopus tropicalis]|nr:hypothetical protein XENTR_v10010969 [Xenopus tropicalis]